MRKGALIAIIVIAVVVIGGIAGFLIYNNSLNTTSSGNDSGSGSISVSGGSSGSGLSFEENQEADAAVVRGVTMPGWEYMEIAGNTKDVTVDLYNPETNAGYYYLTFELKLKDTGETLYKSGLVKAGDHVRKIQLSRALEPGEYSAVLTIQPYTADENLTAKNGGIVSFKLKVLDV